MDHGTTVGPIAGLEDMRTAISNVVRGGANAILMHKGVVGAGHRGAGRDVGLIIHLSAGTILSPDPNAKELVCTVEESDTLPQAIEAMATNIGGFGYDLEPLFATEDPESGQEIEAPPEATAEHVQVLGQIAKLVRDAEILASLMNAPAVDDLLAILRDGSPT